MSVKRNEQTGRFESDNTDFFMKKMEEHNAAKNAKIARMLLGDQRQEE